MVSTPASNPAESADSPQPAAARVVPLCVDLDGTLIAGDTLWESLLILLRRRPLDALRTPLWAIRGPSAFKRQVAQRVDLDAAALPYRADVLAFLRQEKALGRPLILATAADRAVAQAVADHLGVFDEVIATQAGVNAKGEAKLEAIRSRLGGRPFDYMGDADCDWPICDAARMVYLVNPTVALRERMRSRENLSRVFDDVGRRSGAKLAGALMALRPQQWVKNLLLIVPMLVGQRLGEASLWVDIIAAMVWFSLCASSVYITNDLMDLAADRRHPRKRRRPFARGVVSIPEGLAMSAALLAVGLLGALATLPAAFLALLAVYVATSTAYSLRLKRTPMLDVIVLAGLYTLRIIAGGTAVDVFPSFWLLAFSVFIFLSLAFGKRYSELRVMAAAEGAGAQPNLASRGYRHDDLPLLGVLGPTSGYLAVLVFCLYIASDAVTVLYARPALLWLMCPLLLYWISRFWLKSHRGEMRDDPVFFALTDWPTYALAGLGLAILVAANG